MIKIERKTPPKGTTLDRRKQEELEKLEELVRKGELNSKSFNSRLWSNDDVKDFLYKSQYGKCCYCERKRDQKREFDVEHFRPKSEVKEDSEHPGYWWLAYEWSNLLISCKKCNQEYKEARFPVKEKQDRAHKPGDNIEKEDPYLLNPLLENPEDFIEYDIRDKALMIKAIGKCERAEKTINELTGINDRQVMEERANKLKDYKDTLDVVGILGDKSRIERHTESSSVFTGFARFYFKEMLK